MRYYQFYTTIFPEHFQIHPPIFPTERTTFSILHKTPKKILLSGKRPSSAPAIPIDVKKTLAEQPETVGVTYHTILSVVENSWIPETQDGKTPSAALYLEMPMIL